MKLPVKIFIFISLVIYGSPLLSQHKKPMDHSIYEQWNYLQREMITDDGKFVGYELQPGKGDGLYCIYNTADGSSDTIERGSGVKVMPGSGYLVGRISPPVGLVRQAKKEKKSKEDADYPRDSLFVYNLNTGETVRFADVRSFSVPKRGSEWIVLYHNYHKEKRGDDTTSVDSLTKKFSKLRADNKVASLVLYNTESKQSYSWENVYDYSFSENGTLLAFQQLVPDTVPVTVTYSMAVPDESLDIIHEGNGIARSTASGREGRRLAFTFSADTSLTAGLDLCYWEIGDPGAKVVVDSSSHGLFSGWGVNRYGKLWFSADGKRLFFGTSPVPEPSPEDTLLEEEKPHLDVWSWNDHYLQPQQKKLAERTRKKNYLALYNVETKKMVQLADTLVEQVITMHKGKGNVMLGYETGPYKRQSSWEGVTRANVYLVNPETGNKTIVASRLSSTFKLSPFGNYVVYYQPEDSSWYSYIVKTGETVNLTKKINTAFYDEENDTPRLPDDYGVAGFTQHDDYLLVYDRYDIWSIDPSGKKNPFCLTSGYGRRTNQRLRYVSMDKEAWYIDMDEPLYLSTFNERTMQKGYAYIYPNGQTPPRQLLQSMDAYSRLKKAHDTGLFIFAKGNFKDYPDIYLTDERFRDLTRISDANPQESEYLWGEAKLVNWTSYRGEALKGMLFTPENLNPGRKYPMLVYFYEKSSDQLYTYHVPNPSRSIISIPWCTSNGYVVFVPDITYRIGHPGQSAYDAVVSGTRAMVRQFPFIDSTRMGLQGQSWGGYQVAYLVTKTNMFAAAMAGAPVSNMTSAYGGIRWGTGMSRMFQYEQTQSRLGVTLWENPERYIENSPLFFVPDIQTPLLIMHNDSDGAVPWYQGIEFFTALRRLDKKAWMLSYNNEDHNLTKWPDRVDLSIRMMQFFDHYLKGKAEPQWMARGVPAVRKGIDPGYELMK